MKVAYRGPRSLPTNSIENAMFPNDWSDLLGHENEQDSRAKGEEKVVYLEEGVEALRRVVLQEGLNSKDSGEVRDERGRERRPGRERCNARLPAHIRLRNPEEDWGEDGQQGVGDLNHFSQLARRTRANDCR